jgi:ABC-2 type transport system ATP-binding protein
MLHFTQFEKSYGTEPVIAIPDLTIKEGIYWLQGENGAGKTTLLKTVAGLIPFKGRISIGNTDIKKQRVTYRKLINWADAEPLYPDFLSGIDLIDFYEQTKLSDRSETIKILKAFGADQFIRQKVSTYSSGMTKKLSITLAFIGQPKWILLDEPLITLDTAAVNACLSLIHEYNQRGVSFLITSHQSFIQSAPFATQFLHVKNKTLVSQ